MRLVRAVPLALVMSSLLALPGPAAASDDTEPAVYLKLAEPVSMSVDDAVVRLQGALDALGWVALEPLECGVNVDKCTYRSRVVTAWHPEYARRVMPAGAHAAFAVPVRFGVFEDELGVHVAATNPRNLNRTIVDEASSPEDWSWAVEMIRDVGRRAFPDAAVEIEYGQHRRDARIGKTMGVMAGGAFVDQLEVVASLSADEITPAQTADLLYSYIEMVDGDWEWGIRPVYVLDMPEHGVSVLGVSGAAMEAKAFDIVGAGGNDERDDLACPGIDHAPAFPIELVISQNGDRVEIVLVDEMYRMKMFFEDAGKWAFMKNMGMPGSIEDEIKDKVRAIVN